MKKLLLPLCFITSFGAAKAQITLEHNYPTATGINMVKIESDGEKYIGSDTSTKNIQLFNTDHSLWKTVPSAISGLNVGYFGFASKYLFNSDSKIELLLSYSSGSTHGYKIINEDGTLIMDFPDALYVNVNQIAGAWKLMVTYVSFSTYQSNSTVYSLPGSYSGLKVRDISNDASAILFPNPVEVSATLQYKLPASDHTAQLSIYNSTGSMVKQVTITDRFNDITISRDELPAGIYIYNITTPSGTTISSKFQIE